MQRFSRRITGAILTSASILVGCGDRDAASADAHAGGSSTAASAHAVTAAVAIDEKNLPLPEFYGVHAIAPGGKLIEITSGKVPIVVPADAEFIVYEKGLAAGVTEWNISRVAIGLDGAASPTAAVAIRRKGVANQPEMIRLLPTAAMEPGEYQIREKLRFVVSPEKLRAGPIVGQWIDAKGSIGPRSAITFNNDGTYEIVLIGGEAVENEAGVWTLDGQRLTTTSSRSTDGRPPGTVDVVNVERLAGDVLVLQDPQKPKARFHYVRATPAMLQDFAAARRGEPSQSGRTDRFGRPLR